MKITGWFYLKKDGNLVYTPDKSDGIRGVILSMLCESDVVAFWPWKNGDRDAAWRILVESLAGGADRHMIGAFAEKAGCTDPDAARYASRIGCILAMEGVYWRATRRDFEPGRPAGYGATGLDALADLARQLGYKPSKILAMSFKDLLK